MTDKDTEHYEGALLEEINSKVDRLTEALADVPARVCSIDERLSIVETDVKVIKAAVTDQSKQLHDHEQRLTQLEQPA